MGTEIWSAGLDLGTTSAKAVVFNDAGEVQAEAERFYAVKSPVFGYAEQDPYEIEEAALEAIKEAVTSAPIAAEKLIGIGLSSAMHTLICTDESGEALSPVIIFSDGRAHAEAERLISNGEASALYERTGVPVHPMSPLTKLCWMKNANYQPYLIAERFCSIKDWLLYRWFGEFVVDYGTASASGLFNMQTLQWDELALETAGIKAEQLARPVPPTYTLGPWHTKAAERTGLPVETPVAAGGADGALANIGIGALQPGETAVTIGTSGAVRQLTNTPQTDEAQATFCYAVTEELWLIGGGTNNGGNVLDWLSRTIGDQHEQDAAALLSAAASSTPGANHLLCLPLLHGERAPYWDVKARGSFVGLTNNHSTADMLRAGVEGVVYNLAHVHEALNKHGVPTSAIYANGGFAQSPFWLQLVADIFEQPVEVPVSHQSAAWGAAWFARMAADPKEKLVNIKARVPMEKRLNSRGADRSAYRSAYQSYRRLYEALQPVMHALSEQQSAIESPE
ncbi:gluconate kinase (FGGY family) [Salsuginibacillus halophilus]|uniref:Gluconate kinase (FGGY family) n=1 Tax=Salsuginibacillus halophilus TaxID=517424 RepID=A0A2P8HQR7_9BACI|nr:gluconokinase [Salsuginibacillus halophilus]PSL48532.1 gluconate kinase (FGGY family) [Salsuginibacillus halophilus]